MELSSSNILWGKIILFQFFMCNLGLFMGHGLCPRTFHGCLGRVHNNELRTILQFCFRYILPNRISTPKVVFFSSCFCKRIRNDWQKNRQKNAKKTRIDLVQKCIQCVQGFQTSITIIQQSFGWILFRIYNYR